MIKKESLWTLVLCFLLYYCLTHVVQTRFRVQCAWGKAVVILKLFFVGQLFWNASSRCVIEEGIVTDVRLFLENTPYQIVVTEEGIVIVVRLFQAKVLPHIVVIEFGIVTEVSKLFEKESLYRVVTVSYTHLDVYKRQIVVIVVIYP